MKYTQAILAVLLRSNTEGMRDMMLLILMHMMRIPDTG